jgi:hypothetical protein
LPIIINNCKTGFRKEISDYYFLINILARAELPYDFYNLVINIPWGGLFLSAVGVNLFLFCPDQTMWSVILRDSGYTALDPSRAPLGVASELRGSGRNPMNGNLCARIPVWRGEKQPLGETLSVFAQVELTVDPDPSLQSRWIPFVEYQNARILQSRPPIPSLPDFLEWIGM